MNLARFVLLVIFVISLVAQLLAFLAVGHKMWPEDLQALVTKLLAVYSVHLSVILGGIFAQSKSQLEDPPAGLTWTALILNEEIIANNKRLH